jgi:hypothetical protein
VEIYVENLSSFDNFVEYVFRNLGKDIIVCVGFDCPNFEKLKMMNVMIPEIYYIYGHNDNNVFDQIYYKTIEDRISEYRGINNEEPYRTEEPFFRY